MCKNCCIVLSPKDISKANELKVQRAVRGKLLEIIGVKEVCIKFEDDVKAIKKIAKEKNIVKVIIDGLRLSEEDIQHIKNDYPDVPIFYNFDDLKSSN